MLGVLADQPVAPKVFFGEQNRLDSLTPPDFHTRSYTSPQSLALTSAFIGRSATKQDRSATGLRRWLA